MRGKAIIAAFALAASFGGMLPARAAKTVTVDIAAFQYLPSGRITTVPIEPIVGSPLITVGPLAAPRVNRGEVISFANHDPMAHKVDGGVRFSLSIGSGATANLYVTSAFASGEYRYFCSIHTGMVGSFVVA